jgi:vacuolar-type H+-ATPase subunit H
LKANADLRRANAQVQQMLDNAQKMAQKIIQDAIAENKKAVEMVNNANERAQQIIDKAEEM